MDGITVSSVSVAKAGVLQFAGAVAEEGVDSAWIYQIEVNMAI